MEWGKDFFFNLGEISGQPDALARNLTPNLHPSSSGTLREPEVWPTVGEGDALCGLFLQQPGRGDGFRCHERLQRKFGRV